jgi:hypothetical protein
LFSFSKYFEENFVDLYAGDYTEASFSFLVFSLHSLLISHLSTQGNQKINLYGVFERE